MAAHPPLFVKGSLSSLPSSSPSSCTYSSIWHTAAFPGFHLSPAAANKSVKWGAVQRMDGVRWVKHRMVFLNGKMKKKQQIGIGPGTKWNQHLSRLCPGSQFLQNRSNFEAMAHLPCYFGSIENGDSWLNCL